MRDGSEQNGEAVRLAVTSDTVHLAEVRAAVGQAASEAGLPECEVNSVALAIDEAVSNIIRHGYASKPQQPIELEISRVCADGRPALRFVLLDRGRQVEPCEIVGRDLQDIRPGGLGTHIIRSVMDQVDYSKREGGGMRLCLLKYLDSPRKSLETHSTAEGKTDHAR